MGRSFAFMVACMAVAACARSPESLPPHAALPSKTCDVVATQRGADAIANGIDNTTARLIFADTYKDCVQWNGKAADLAYPAAR
jgi:hypothetical protein